MVIDVKQYILKRLLFEYGTQIINTLIHIFRRFLWL